MNNINTNDFVDANVDDIQVDSGQNETQTETVSSTATDLGSNTVKEPRRLVVWIDETDAIKYINESFSQDAKLHNFYSCKNERCTNLSPGELKRLSTKGDRFQHAWIMDKKLTYCEKTGYNWLIYEEGHGMFCAICQKHNSENARNKCKLESASSVKQYRNMLIVNSTKLQSCLS